MGQDRYSMSYNEAVVDAFYWDDHLPDSVEAIITSGAPATTAMYMKFLQTYDLSADDVPLIEFHKDRAEPFILSPSYAQSGHVLDSGMNSPSRNVNVPMNVQTGAGHTGDVSDLGYGR